MDVECGVMYKNDTAGIWISMETDTFSRGFISSHDVFIKWNHFPRYWPCVREIQRWPVDSAHEDQWCRALISAPEQTAAQTIEMPVIWDAIALISTLL